jgi:nucleotide-binding universal stress UspA family protein
MDPAQPGRVPAEPPAGLMVPLGREARHGSRQQTADRLTGHGRRAAAVTRRGSRRNGPGIRERDLPHATFVRDAVVVGCDGGLSCDAAIRFAAGEARLRGAELVVVIAYGRPVDPDLPSFYTSDGELRSRARRAAEQAVGRALGQQAAGLPGVHVVTERGPAPWVLLQEYRQAQLLVVGTRPRRLRQGRTVRYLTRHSPVPVVVVPPAREPG